MRQDQYPGTSGTMKNIPEYRETRANQRGYTDNIQLSLDTAPGMELSSQLPSKTVDSRASSSYENIPSSTLLKQLESGQVPTVR